MAICFLDPDQIWLESALRGRAARRTRALLRRSFPVHVRAPRWSDPVQFLEELSLDLAVGEPPLGCRRIALRHLKGAPAPRARLEILRALESLARPHGILPPSVPADRGGFRAAIAEHVDKAVAEVPHAMALLFSEVDHLPVEVGEDLLDAWSQLLAAHAPEPRISLLLTSSAELGWTTTLAKVDLSDFGENEAAAEITRHVGPIDPQALRSASLLSGGVPALVEGLAPMALAIAADPDAAIAQLEIVDELRGAVDIASMDPRLGARLADLADGARDREDDDALLVAAGLARTTRDARHTELRSPVFARFV
jgi:hypothetical protein